MPVPAPVRAPTDVAWGTLSPAEKPERLLGVATRLFQERGVEGVTMPAIAAAAGASVGSLYRQFASKDDLVLALAVRRLASVQARLDEAAQDPDAGRGLEAFVRGCLESHAADDVLARAMTEAYARPEAARTKARLTTDLERLLTRAQDQGAIRADASYDDVALLFVTARAVRGEDPARWRRAIDLLLAGLRRA